MAYNVQATVDAKHCLLLDYRVTNHNDRLAMGGMLRRAKSIVRNNTFTALFDKGYYAGSELETAQGLGITALVAVPAPAANAPDPAITLSTSPMTLQAIPIPAPKATHSPPTATSTPST